MDKKETKECFEKHRVGLERAVSQDERGNDSNRKEGTIKQIKSIVTENKKKKISTNLRRWGIQ